MHRRQFITLVGGAATWPLAVRAQQSRMPVIGHLCGESPERWTDRLRGFARGLKEVGYSEGQNVAIEHRWAEANYGRLPALAADLVIRRVAVIVADGAPAAVAAKAANTIIPIVFFTGGDPVRIGLVASLNRPGENVTGVSVMNVELATKRLDLLQKLVPGASRFAMLVNPNSPLTNPLITELRAAPALRDQLEILAASSNREIDAAFADVVQKRTDGLLLAPDGFFSSRRVQLAMLAVHHRLPAIYSGAEYVNAGGLMSYASNFPEAYRQVGIYTGRVLKGDKPTHLPVLQPTKFEFVINLQAAKMLGLTIPNELLSVADQVIE